MQSILRRAGADAAAATESLSDLAVRNSDTLLPPSLSAGTSPATRRGGHHPQEELPPLVVTTPDGLRFNHDVIREYFAAGMVAPAKG